MKRRVRRKTMGAVTGLLLLVTAAASAHHSSALFDPSRSVPLQGIVAEFRWTNPHAVIQLQVVDGGEWSVETNSPEYLARAGWQPNTLKAGDAVTFVVHPMRDGTKRGLFVSGTGPQGPLIDAVPAARVAAPITMPAVTSGSCPRIDLTRVEPSPSADTRPVNLGEQAVFVRSSAIASTSDIAELEVTGDDTDTLIRIKYKPEAATRVMDATTDHDGLKLAFVVDDDVWLAFTWRGPYGIGSDGTQVSLRHGLGKATRLVESLRRCIAAPTR